MRRTRVLPVALVACSLGLVACGSRSEAGERRVYQPDPVETAAEIVAVSTSEYVLVGRLAELDQSGEGLSQETYAAAVSNGPVTDTVGNTYGNDSVNDAGEVTAMADYIGVSDPDDPDLTIVGFLSREWRGPTPNTVDVSTADVPVFGFGGRQIGYFKRTLHSADEMPGIGRDYYTTEFVAQ